VAAAYRWAPATEVALYGYSRIIFSALLGLFLWAEIPDLASVAGGLLILAGGFVAFLRRPSTATESTETSRCTEA